MPEAKRYVVDSIKICKPVAEMANCHRMSGGTLEKLRAAVGKLDDLQEKVFLKTQKALNSAFAVLECARAVKEAFQRWQQAAEAGKPNATEDLEDTVTEFERSVSALESACKKHSIIIT